MKTAIIASKKDLAGINIASFLEKEDLSQYNSKLYLVEKESIYNDDIDKEIEADLFIFATKHQSEKGVHSLSCHAPGNWSKAEVGGKDKTLCIAPAILLKNAFLELNKLAKNLDHEVTLEVTHHGPYLEKPCFFIEIGSDEKNWQNKEAGKIISKVIINLLKNKNNNYKIALGIGGPHYCNTFNKVLLRTNIALGHICPKYQLQNLNKEILLQAIEKTIPKPEFLLLDWKGLGKEKQRIMELIKELNLEFKRTDNL